MRVVHMHAKYGHFIFRSSSLSNQAKSIRQSNNHVVITYMLATKHYKRGITIYRIAHEIHHKNMYSSKANTQWVTYQVTPHIYKFVDGHAIKNKSNQKYQGQTYHYHLQNFNLQGNQWVRYLNKMYP